MAIQDAIPYIKHITPHSPPWASSSSYNKVNMDGLVVHRAITHTQTHTHAHNALWELYLQEAKRDD